MSGAHGRVKSKNPHGAISKVVAGVGQQLDGLVTIVQDVGASPSDRIAAAEVIRSLVEFQSMSSVSEIWYATQPLLGNDNISDVRRAGWRLMLSCLGRDELNNSTVSAYYSAIVAYANIEDFDLVLASLNKLTLSGRKTISTTTARNLPHVLIRWMQMLALKTQELRSSPNLKDPAEQAGGQSSNVNFHELLEYTARCLKFNMHIWEPIEIEKLLLTVVAIIRRTSEVHDCRLCCRIIDTVISYGLVPATVLQPILEVLCALITIIPELREESKAIVSSLSSGHLRNVTCIRLCSILDSPTAEITVAMRSAAAVELAHFLVKQDLAQRSDEDEDTSAAPSVSQSLISDSGSPTVSGDKEPYIDIAIPIYEVLEAYHRTLKEDKTPLRLTVTILDCVLVLITKMSVLQRLYTSAGQEEGSPSEIIRLLSEIYRRNNAIIEEQGTNLPQLRQQLEPQSSQRSQVSFSSHSMREDNIMSSEDLMLMDKFRTLMADLAACISGAALDKLGPVDPYEQIYSCLQLCDFLDQTSCQTLLCSIDALQFCTPGIRGWESRVREVVDKLYIHRKDSSRVQVLKVVRPVFSLEPFEEGWISEPELTALTSLLFGEMSSADTHLLESLEELFENQIFHTAKPVFRNTCRRLASVATESDNPAAALSAVNALIKALAKAFLIHDFHGKLIISTLIDICRNTFDKPDVFSRSFSVVCRLRVDTWDKLLLVETTTEPSYGKTLSEYQEPLPPVLASIHSVNSLVLQLSPASDPKGLSLMPVIELIVEVLRRMESLNERTVAIALINTASMLTNCRIFEIDAEASAPVLQELNELLLQFVGSGGTKFPRTAAGGVKQSCVCVAIHALTILLPYKDLFQKTEYDKLIHTLVVSISQSVQTTGWAVSCFTVACYESASSVQKYLPQILSQLQLKITNRECSMHILDFLLSLALEGSLTKNFTEQDYKRVFGMCFSFIQNTHDWLHRVKSKDDVAAQWLIRLAYSAVENLFLNIPLRNRKHLVSFLIRNLILANHDPTSVDPNSLVVYDMVNMFAYSDVPSRVYMDKHVQDGPEWETRRWLRGIVVTEIRTNRKTGEAIRIIRRPAGVITTRMRPALSDYEVLLESESIANDDTMPYSANYYFLCGQLSLATFPKVVPAIDDISAVSTTSVTPLDSPIETRSIANSLIPDTSAPISRQSPRSVPIAIPDEPQANRAISTLDRVPIVDFYKVGVIYVGPGQCTEKEILGNTSGSEAYRRFLEGIGNLIRLKNNRFYYVGGLDTQEDLDGKFAIAWSSKIQQIIFHTITMMPTVEGDDSFSSKKRHIGNDFVNIYFDESGIDFEFDVVQSQFNFIQVVITPASYSGERKYWKVRAYRKEGMRNTMAAYEFKVVQDCNLALFVRNLCLKASQYAAIHNLGGDYMDNWVYRLHLIEQLTDRVSKLEAQRGGSDSAEKELATEGLELSDSEPEITLANWMDFTKYTS